MKDVIILAHYVSQLDGKGNSRFLYLADMIGGDADVEIITSDFNHTTKSPKHIYSSDLPYKVTHLHEPGYPTNVCLQRFWSHYVWGMNVKKYLKSRKTPDCIYCSVPSLTGPLEASKYSKKNGIQFIIDIQDLWPEAFQMVFNIPIIRSILYWPFKRKADQIYKNAGVICAVSQTYVDRALLVNKKIGSGQVVFLGTELKDFDQHAKKFAPIDRPSDELWLGYCGTLGSSYDLTSVFDALEVIRDSGAIIPKFIVMGDGPRKQGFEEYASSLGLDVLFTGRLAYPEMVGLLCACDITVNPIRKGSAGSIINKHADYAAAGLPVLNTQECKEYRDLVDEYQMGFNCINEDANDLAEKMLMLINDPELRKEMGVNARRRAEELFDRAKTYEILKNTILS